MKLAKSDAVCWSDLEFGVIIGFLSWSVAPLLFVDPKMNVIAMNGAVIARAVKIITINEERPFFEM